MPFNIRFDYRFDTNGWFTPEKKASLTAAADIWQNNIFDQFPTTAVGTKTPYVLNPQTGDYVGPDNIFTTDTPIDDVVIFVGARPLLQGGAIGRGGSSGWYQNDPRYVSANFEPWMGSIAFDRDYSWFFDSTPATSNDIPYNKVDFISVALHEIGHVLGINSGTTAFKNLTSGNTFVGTSSRLATHGAGIPLSDDLSHTKGGGNVMDPAILWGKREFLTPIDFALLEDIGYQTYQTPVDDYLASNSDLIGAFGYNLGAAREHYTNYGFYEGRQTDLFVEQRYLDIYPDLKASFGNDTRAATKHYIETGYREGRSSLAGFNADTYVASYKDLIGVFGYNLNAATQHYADYGYSEGRQTSFKSDIYIASNKDLINAFGYNLGSGTKHYITYGSSEGRATDLFNPSAYLNFYSDLRAAFGNDTGAATSHYINYGYREGRTHIS